MKRIGSCGLALAAASLLTAPLAAAPQLAAKPGSALSRASLTTIATNVRAGKRLKRENDALIGLPLIFAIAAGVAATVVVATQVADNNNTPNSP